jgi:predicted dinucleotide-binding enzyme
MKKSLVLLSAFAALLVSSSAFAYSPNGSAAKLVPSKVVNPTDLPRTFTRTVVNVEFTLDASGQPKDITVATNDRNAKEQIEKAFKQWRFETPSRDVLAKRFVLPLEIVPSV